MEFSFFLCQKISLPDSNNFDRTHKSSPQEGPQYSGFSLETSFCCGFSYGDRYMLFVWHRNPVGSLRSPAVRDRSISERKASVPFYRAIRWQISGNKSLQRVYIIINSESLKIRVIAHHSICGTEGGTYAGGL